MFKPDVQDVEGRAEGLARGHGGRARTVWSGVRGFALELPEQAAARVAESLGREEDVAAVAEDAVVSATAVQSDPPSWGLDRIDERQLPMSGSYTFNRQGAGVHVYVMDTGIRATHAQFGGRVGNGANFIWDGRSHNTDCHGHGTHVASTVGGSTVGVAKQVSLHSVRVLGCDGMSSATSIIDGINWIILFGVRKSVVNMSLGIDLPLPPLDVAVDAMTAAGFFVVVAAGNANINACNASPARAATAFAVGATTRLDRKASFSNFGSCVDLFAPGEDIVGTKSGSTSDLTTMDGTSMAAAPATCGAALLLSQTSNNFASLAALLRTNATTNVLTSIGANSPNRLLFTGFIN
jgi:subtilisin family serine protease